MVLELGTSYVLFNLLYFDVKDLKVKFLFTMSYKINWMKQLTIS